MNVLLFMQYTESPSWGFQSASYDILQGLIKSQAELEKNDVNIFVFSQLGETFSKKSVAITNNISLNYYKILPPRSILADLQHYIRVLGDKEFLSNIDVIHSHDISFTAPASVVFKKNWLCLLIG